MKNLKFKASQCLINTIHQNQGLIFELFELIRIIIDNNKITNLSKDVWKGFKINQVEVSFGSFLLLELGRMVTFVVSS